MSANQNMKDAIQQAELEHEAWCDDCHGYEHTSDCPAYAAKNSQLNLTGRKVSKVEFCQCAMPLGSKTCHHCKKPVKPVESRLTATESIYRDAILDRLDVDEFREWDFYASNEDEANAQRLDFADAVIKRARAIKQFDDQEALVSSELNNGLDRLSEKVDEFLDQESFNRR